MIDLTCPNCGQWLRVPDDAAGKQAKCPACEALQPVPMPEAAGDFAPAAEARDGDDNPFQSPQAAGGPASGSAAALVTGERVDLRAAFSQARTILQRRWQIILGAIALVMALNFVATRAGNFLATELAINNAAAGGPITFVCNMLVMIFAAYLGIGQTRVLLAAARGQKVSLGTVFSGADNLLPIIGASILFGLIVGFGLVLLIIPGVFLLLMLSQYYLLIVDRDAGVIESLERSSQLTRGSKWQLLAIHLFSGAISGAGVFLSPADPMSSYLLQSVLALTFGAYAVMLQIAAYLQMIGEPAEAVEPDEPLAAPREEEPSL